MLDILIIFLVMILLIAQYVLAARQIKKKCYDGKILLVINIIITILWIPLSCLKLITNIIFINIAWFIVAAAYMIFTIWYTKMLAKTF